MADVTVIAPRRGDRRRAALQELLPKLVLAPSFALILLFVYGFILFTVVLSFTGSKLLPDFTHLGRLRQLPAPVRASELDDRAQEPGDLRHALHRHLQRARASAWRSCSTRRSAAKACCGRSISIRWRFPSSSPASPGSGSSIPASGSSMSMHQIGLGELLLPLDQGRQMAIYTIVIAAVWQSSGFVMAMFLAGLRGVDNEIIKAAQIDGASTFMIYRRIIIPLMRPVFLSAFVVLAHLAIKSYDLVVAHDRRRARHGDLDAGALHVEIHLQPQRDGHGRRIGDHHADDDLLDHHPLSLFRTARGTAHMSAASQDNATPHRRVCARRDLCGADPVRRLLPAAALCDAGQFAEAAGRDPAGQHAGAAAAMDDRALAQRLVDGADRRAADRAQALLHQFHPDGGAGGLRSRPCSARSTAMC